MVNPLIEHGRSKFPNADVIASSAGRAWAGVYAERRGHWAGELPPYRSEVTEVTFALAHRPDASVHRSGSGRKQVTPVRRNTIWLCPAGILEDDTRITGDLPDILHVTLPAPLFSSVQDELTPILAPDFIRYEGGVEDPLLAHMLLTIASELGNETSSGGLLVESTTLALGARLALKYGSRGELPSLSDRQGPFLDVKRLSRVIEYINAHLDSQLSVVELAKVACLSRFHFSRSFKRATGRTPHAFVSFRRLERAKTLLQDRRVSISEIAGICGFSSQANFSKAFSRATGAPPSRFRIHR